MEKIPHPFEYLKGKFVYVSHLRKEAGADQIIMLRAKVLDVDPDGKLFKIEYDGNNNLIFDGNVEDDVGLGMLATKSSGGEVTPLTEDEFPLDPKELGTWNTIPSEQDQKYDLQ
jgi:hypothetical protein